MEQPLVQLLLGVQGSMYTHASMKPLQDTQDDQSGTEQDDRSEG
jgi:hypothetical protein